LKAKQAVTVTTHSGALSSVQLWWKRRILPGFGVTLGFTLVYLSLIVLIPLSAAFLKASGLGWEAFFRAVSTPRVIASFEVSFGISLLAAGINVLFGGIVAWVLGRYRFSCKKALDS
jgi:sulfate transport system permease protein